MDSQFAKPRVIRCEQAFFPSLQIRSFNHFGQMRENQTSRLIAKVLMWTWWGFLAWGCLPIHVFLATNDAKTNSLSGSSDVFGLGMMIIPFCVWMAWRFLLLPKIANPWLQMVLFGIGVFFSQQIIFYGIFLMPTYRIVFYGICAVAMLAYLPFWVKPKSRS
ncbi:hypothetical protein JIN85_17315 [Luteolibacter pohnpeiensis]|uniref:Uncharacterized protein n=1 Tax=Luteolibacter pohnpeiensis TaxID=454153 RepID=A0A934VW25_9BACT|nr:hypothetical protein [Luteolibacter pohnpeiensis]MBK1884182.1 hypothetical protein [Luteolibacter pohnpeiensis]